MRALSRRHRGNSSSALYLDFWSPECFIKHAVALLSDLRDCVHEKLGTNSQQPALFSPLVHPADRKHPEVRTNIQATCLARHPTRLAGCHCGPALRGPPQTLLAPRCVQARRLPGQQSESCTPSTATVPCPRSRPAAPVRTRPGASPRWRARPLFRSSGAMIATRCIEPGRPSAGSGGRSLGDSAASLALECGKDLGAEPWCAGGPFRAEPAWRRIAATGGGPRPDPATRIRSVPSSPFPEETGPLVGAQPANKGAAPAGRAAALGMSIIDGQGPHRIFSHPAAGRAGLRRRAGAGRFVSIAMGRPA